MSNINITCHFVNSLKGSEQGYQDIAETSDEKPTVSEVVSRLNHVGKTLHEQVLKEENKETIATEIVQIFTNITEACISKEEKSNSYVDEKIKRAGIAYGVLSGFASAAIEHIE